MEHSKDMAITIYYGAGSCAFSVLVALEQAGVIYRPIKLDLAAGEQRNQDYLAINPRGRVPAMVVDGTVITEALAVLSYLACRYPAARILPIENPLLFGKALEMLGWFSSTVHVHLAQVLRGARFVDDADVIERLKQPGRQRYAAAMSQLEEKVRQSGEFLIGDTFSAVDAFALVLWRWIGRLEIDAAVYPLLSAKATRDLSRQIVVQAVAVEKNGKR
jgi:glutathione S-transferase